MSTTRFTHIAIINETPEKARLAIDRLEGISLAHEPIDADSVRTDGGRLWGQVAESGGKYVIDLWSDVSHTAAAYQGVIEPAALGSFTLSTAGAAGTATTYTGAGRLLAYEGPCDFIAVPSFAIDVDVQTVKEHAQAYPGYDAKFGLAHFHARAVAEIIGSILPRVAPGAFVGRASPFVPISAALLDLLLIKSGGELRELQAALVKAIAWTQLEHTEEGANLVDRARQRVEATIERLELANKADPDETTSDAVNKEIVLAVSEFTRG